jgi:hypothetical protein
MPPSLARSMSKNGKIGSKKVVGKQRDVLCAGTLLHRLPGKHQKTDFEQPKKGD